MANFNNQLQRMKSLMTYGAVNENKESNNGAMEYHAIGADGKSYGIIRENQKFYIKVAPKSKEMMVEAYEYIGGFNNKKGYEYQSYNNALKNFELKMISLKESYSPKVNIESLTEFELDGEVMTEGTKKMMSEIARQRQIMNNAAAILNENSTISCKNTGVPEAPKTTSFNDKIGKPFEIAAKAELDGDFKKTSESPEKQGEPFGDTEKPETEKDAEYVPSGSVANQKPKGGKVVKVNESTKKLWEMMAKLDNTFTLNESFDDEWTEEEVSFEDEPVMEDENIAGIADDNFEAAESDIDDVETEPEFDDEDMGDEDIDDDFAFGDEETEETEEFGEDDFDVEDDFEGEEMPEDEFDAEEDMEMDVDGDGEIGGDSEIDALRAEIDALRAEIAQLKGEEMPEDEFDAEEGEEMPEDEGEFDPEKDGEFGDFDESMLDDFDDEEDDFDDEEMPEDEFDAEEGEEMPEDEFDAEEGEEMPEDEDEFGISESRKAELMPIVENLVKTIKSKKNLKEDKLNDFGKHPGYRKKPMTLPTTGSDKEGEMKDWNDESVYSEQPFGSKIGDSAPYEELVQKVTNSVMESLMGKKKI